MAETQQSEFGSYGPDISPVRSEVGSIGPEAMLFFAGLLYDTLNGIWGVMRIHINNIMAHAR